VFVIGRLPLDGAWGFSLAVFCHRDPLSGELGTSCCAYFSCSVVSNSLVTSGVIMFILLSGVWVERARARSLFRYAVAGGASSGGRPIIFSTLLDCSSKRFSKARHSFSVISP